MNCQDIALLLDDRDVRDLGHAEREHVDEHLRTCAECAAAWDAHARVLETPVAAMRSEFPRDVWHTLAQSVAGKSARPRFVRPTLIGLVLAAAAAAMLALQWAPPRETAAAAARNDWTPPPTELKAQAGDAAPLAPFRGAVDGQVAGDAGESSLAAPAQRSRLVVLPTLHETSNQAAIDDVDATRASFVQFLRDQTDLDVVELDELQVRSVPTNLSLSYAFRWLTSFGRDRSLRHDRDRAVASAFGSENAVRFGGEEPRYELGEGGWGVGFIWTRRSGGGYHSRAIRPWQEESDARHRGEVQARVVYSQMSPQSAGTVYARLVGDTGRTDRQRLDALRERYLGEGHTLGFREDEVFDAALELARGALVPETRREAWQILGGTGHSAIMRPLMDALRLDGDAKVRRAAA
jgi:hypothetical protein